MNIFNKLFNSKRTVSVKLDDNIQLTVTPAVGGGVHAVLTEMGEIFSRRESCYFATCEELVKSLRLTDDRVIGKLSKAF